MLHTEAMVGDAGAWWYFDQAAEVEAITSQAFVYADEQAAAAAPADYREVVGRCLSWQMGTAKSGYSFQEEQAVFDAGVGAESVARIGTTASIPFPEVPASSVYWVSARVGPSIVQVTYRPGSLLDSAHGRNRTVELAAAAINRAEGQR